MLRPRDDRAGLPVLQRARRHTDLRRGLLLCQQPLVALPFDTLTQRNALDTQLHATHHIRIQRASQAQKGAAMKSAATNSRNFRTFLLVSQLEAKQIGARLQLARKEAGLTQEQVAEMSTVSKRSLQDYEAGVTIPYSNFRELAGIYDRDVDWFLHGEREDTEPPLLEEVAASVAGLTEGMKEAIERLARIEALLSTGGASDTGSTRRR